ncbi:uncharacterized protein LOC143266631 [Megachile rotundata]|uniref:uncharacterized protein LOC143266631 n=1 Tax=Megachile rotundata TaxID=143995 RepID=UPI003FD0E986
MCIQMDVNRSAVAVVMLTRGSYAQMEEFLASMNIKCMSKRQFITHHDEIANSLIAAAEEEMIAAAKVERRLALERGDVVPESGIPHIPVIADGSWMKRSYRTGAYNSASGIGVIVGYYTRKVLFIGVCNKRCKICECAAREQKEPRKHVYFKNWSKSRASTLEKRGLIYSTLIANGDSSVYKKIIDADPYNTEIRVKKIECMNHLLRNFCRKMKEIVKKTTTGTLRKAVENSIRRMRTAIVKAARYRSNESLSTSTKIRNLYCDIYNVPSHVFGEHAECNKINYFCDGKSKENETNIVPQLKSMGVYQLIREILQPLTSHAESLLYNCNNNPVESFNNILAKYIGGKRLNFSQSGSYTARCAAAVLQYNTKEPLSRLNRAMKKRPPPVLSDMEIRRKKKNEKNVEKRKETGIATRVRKQFRSEKDADYGENAPKPDVDINIYKLQQEKHMEMLHNWQEKKDDIQIETIGNF